MRRGFFILGLGLAAAVLAYGFVYVAGTATSRKWLRSEQPELAWLKHEFEMNDAEFSRIAQLHQAYLPRCQERCRQIEDLNRRISETVGGATQVTPEIERLINERGRMRSECQTEMLKHFFEVSQSLPVAQGKRYLAWVQKRTCLTEQVMDHSATGDADHRE